METYNEKFHQSKNISNDAKNRKRKNGSSSLAVKPKQPTKKFSTIYATLLLSVICTVGLILSSSSSDNFGNKKSENELEMKILYRHNNLARNALPEGQKQDSATINNNAIIPTFPSAHNSPPKGVVSKQLMSEMIKKDENITNKTFETIYQSINVTNEEVISQPSNIAKNSKLAELVASSKNFSSSAAISAGVNMTNHTLFPPLKKVMKSMQGGNFTAGQHALDFAILGHAKCGTSTMLFWLAGHPEVAAIPKEMITLQRNTPWHLVQRLYNMLPEGPFKRGYKSPSDVENVRAIRMLRDYFPKTKLFVGLRHPVKWFESFYNFRIQNGVEMPKAETMAFKCRSGQNGVCSDRGRYHINLAKFGKTNLTETEIEVFGQRERSIARNSKQPFTTNMLFLYDTAQLSDKNTTRLYLFRQDVQHYVGLKTELPEVLHFSPGYTGLGEEEQKLRDSKKINICDDKYVKLRRELIRIGTDSQRWIREYFIEGPTVFVSNRDHFLEIMDSYTKDPCNIVTEQ